MYNNTVLFLKCLILRIQLFYHLEHYMKYIKNIIIKQIKIRLNKTHFILINWA